VVRVIGDAYAAAVNVHVKVLSEKSLRQRAREFLDG
jgi:hypothetical protein